MRHTFLHNLAWARVADLHRQAERDRIARAAIRAPRAQAQQRTRCVPAHTSTGLARRVLMLASGRHPSPAG